MVKRKISLIFFFLLVSLFIITGCTDKKTDAYRFKTEYESLNNSKSESGKDIRNLTINETNPFIYKSEDDIVDLINNDETFVVYFGFASCPWCRSVVPTLIETAKKYGLSTIYYVDIKDIRDTYELDGNKPVLKKEGTNGYSKLLDLLEEKLSDYTLTDKDGNTVNVGEKRIYAPNIIGVIEGNIDSIETGISSLQTDGYMDITDEMKNETKEKFTNVIKPVSEALNSCNIEVGC